MGQRHEDYFDGSIPGIDLDEEAGHRHNAAAVTAGVAALAIFTGAAVKYIKSRETKIDDEIPPQE